VQFFEKFLDNFPGQDSSMTFPDLTAIPNVSLTAVKFPQLFPVFQTSGHPANEAVSQYLNISPPETYVHPQPICFISP